jgi:hypothetical protein
MSKASHFLGSVGCFDENVAYSVTSSRKVRCENVETLKTPSKIQAPRIYQNHLHYIKTAVPNTNVQQQNYLNRKSNKKSKNHSFFSFWILGSVIE